MVARVLLCSSKATVGVLRGKCGASVQLSRCFECAAMVCGCSNVLEGCQGVAMQLPAILSVVTVCICSNILEGYQVLLCDCQGVLGHFFNVATRAAPLNS